MTNQDPIGFTVIIPAYNPGALLREALESVANQTVPAVWVVVVDDGSVDGTFEAATGWLAACDLPGIVLRQTNQGISAARNAGMAARRTDVVALLDADDLWLPSHLANLQQAYALCPEAVVAFGDSRFFGHPHSRKDLLAHDIALDISEAVVGERYHLLSSRVFDRLLPGQFIPVSAISFRMDVVGAEPRFETDLKAGLGEDRYFLLQMARRGRFVFCDEQSCRTRRHEANTTHADRSAWLFENALLLLEMIRCDPDLALTPAEIAIVRAAERRTAESLLYAASRRGLAAYRRGLRMSAAFMPRHRAWSLRGFVRAMAVTTGLQRGDVNAR